jgi:hypothetical protein
MIALLKQSIIDSLSKSYGESNRKNISRYLDKKMYTILADILKVAVSNMRHEYHKDNDDIKLFLSNTYRKSWGTLTIDKKQIYAVVLLTPILFEVVSVGHTDVGSAIKIRNQTMDALTEYAIEENVDIRWNPTFDFSTAESVMDTPINIKSLKEYINKLESSRRLDARGLRNLSISKTILTAVNPAPGKILYGIQQPDIMILTQEAVIANSGRCYLNGLNLQNCPKEVRHAALGYCHQYDMRCGAFGVLAAIAKTYAASKNIILNFHNVKYYINNRNDIRMSITNELWPSETSKFKNIIDYKRFGGFYRVKEALTAIGFGAKRNATASWKDINGKWTTTSLNNIFRSKALADKFMSIDVVKELTDEFKLATDIILHRIEEDTVFADCFNLEGLKDSQKLSSIYQGVESIILNNLIDLLSEYGIDILLPVHDGVYINKKVPIIDLHYKLEVPFGLDKSFIQFEHSQVGLSPLQEQEYNHKQSIIKEETYSKQYNTLSGRTSNKQFIQPNQQVMTQWGLIDVDMMM